MLLNNIFFSYNAFIFFIMGMVLLPLGNNIQKNKKKIVKVICDFSPSLTFGKDLATLFSVYICLSHIQLAANDRNPF